MAYDLLSVPAMSAECERIFSSAGMMIVPKRNRLNEDIVEASECLRSWFLRKLGGEFWAQMMYWVSLIETAEYISFI